MVFTKAGALIQRVEQDVKNLPRSVPLALATDRTAEVFVYNAEHYEDFITAKLSMETVFETLIHAENRGRGPHGFDIPSWTQEVIKLCPVQDSRLNDALCEGLRSMQAAVYLASLSWRALGCYC